MAIEMPQHYRVAGLVFSIRGVPYQRRTRIELLVQGPHADCIRRHPEIRHAAMELLAQVLRATAPVKTGHLRDSTQFEPGGRSPTVSIGPERFDRNLEVARIEGRLAAFIENRRRRRQARGARGRIKLQGFYALPANARSSIPGYLDDALDTIAPAVVQLCQQFEQADREITTGLTRIGRLVA